MTTIRDLPLEDLINDLNRTRYRLGELEAEMRRRIDEARVELFAEDTAPEPAEAVPVPVKHVLRRPHNRTLRPQAGSISGVVSSFLLAFALACLAAVLLAMAAGCTIAGDPCDEVNPCAAEGRICMEGRCVPERGGGR